MADIQPQELNEIVSTGVGKLTDPIDIFPTAPAPPPTVLPTPMVQNIGMSPNQIFQKIQDFDTQGKAIQDQIKTEMAKGEVDKLTQQRLSEIEIAKRDLFKQAFPTLEAPQPPQIRDTQKDLGVIGSIMTGLIAVTGMLHGKAGATAFVNVYNGMSDAFRSYDMEEFKKQRELFKDQVELAKMRNEQKLGAYQDVINRMIRGEELDEKGFKLKADLAQKRLALYLEEQKRLDKLTENWTKIYETMVKNEELMTYHMGMLGKPKTESKEELTNKMLYDPNPKERERAKNILDTMEKAETRVAGAKSYITTIERGKAEEEISPPFAKWTPEEKEFMFKRAQLGFTPRFAFGDRKSYTQFYKEQADWAEKKGISGLEFEAGTAEANALKGSLKIQERAYGMMTGFVTNLSRQVDRLKEITKDVQRYDTRLANVGLVEWRTRVAGTPYENKIAMYVVEISTEIGKIATGSQASVRELSVQTRERWEKIHDPNLSIKDLIDVMEETKHAANIRKDSSLDAIKDTQKRLKDIGEPLSPETAPSGVEDLRKKYNY